MGNTNAEWRSSQAARLFLAAILLTAGASMATPCMAETDAGEPLHRQPQAHSDDQGGHHMPEGYEIPPLWAVIPLAVLLLCIAILPLIHTTELWWEHNRT